MEDSFREKDRVFWIDGEKIRFYKLDEKDDGGRSSVEVEVEG